MRKLIKCKFPRQQTSDLECIKAFDMPVESLIDKIFEPLKQWDWNERSHCNS